MNSNDALQTYIRLTTSLEQFGKLPADISSSESEKLEQFVSTQLHLHRAILSSDQAAKMGVSGKQIDTAMNELKQRFPNTETFLETLHSHQLDEKSLKVALRDTLHRENVLDKVSHDVQPLSNEQAESYYFKNLKKFEQPERRQASHILITINDEFEDNQRDKVLTRMAEILNQATVINFPSLAMRYSECPTAMNNGKLGLVGKGQLHAELDEALFNMDANSISEPIETEAGMHILWCENIEPAHRVGFAQAKAQILAVHHQRATKLAKKEWISQLLAKQPS